MAREIAIPGGSDCFSCAAEHCLACDWPIFFDLDTPPAKRDNVVVVRSGNQRLGLVVDQLAGQCQNRHQTLG